MPESLIMAKNCATPKIHAEKHELKPNNNKRLQQENYDDINSIMGSHCTIKSY